MAWFPGSHCAHEDCDFRIMYTDLGWRHVDTHGIDPGHEAKHPEGLSE